MTTVNTKVTETWFGNGVATSFNTGIDFGDNSTMVATLYTNGLIDREWVQGVDYTLVVIDKIASVTAAAPLPAINHVIFRRATPFTQERVLTNNGGLFTNVLEKIFDELTYRDQELAAGTSDYNDLIINIEGVIAERIAAEAAADAAENSALAAAGSVVDAAAETTDASGFATAASGSADAAAASALAADTSADEAAVSATAIVGNGPVFASRAAAVAASIPAAVQIITVRAGSQLLNYTRGATAALTTADGATWAPPFDEVTPNHFAENTTQNSTDMTGAINAAIAYLNSRSTNFFHAGGVLYFLAQKYRVNSTISIQQSGITLQGSGKGPTQITTVSDTITLLNIAGPDPRTDKVERVVVRDLMFWAEGTNPTSNIAIVARRARVLIENCETINFWRGIGLYGTMESCKILNCEITANNQTVATGRSSGIGIFRSEVLSTDPTGYLDATDGLYYGEPNSVFIDNCNIRSGNAGMENCVIVGAVDGLYVTNCHWGFATNACFQIAPQQSNISLSNMLLTGVFFDPKPGTTQFAVRMHPLFGVTSTVSGDITFTNCIMGAPDLDGVSIEMSVARVNIVGNNIKGCGRYGVAVNGAARTIKDINVVNNMIWDTSKTAAFGAAVYVTDVDTYQIVGNMIRNGFRGVQIGVGCVRGMITGNSFTELADLPSIYIATDVNNINIGPNNIADSSSITTATTLFIAPGRDSVSLNGTTNFSFIRAAAPTSSFDGRVITLMATAAVTAVHGATGDGALILPGGSLAMTSGKTLTLAYRFGKWYEVSRT